MKTFQELTTFTHDKAWESMADNFLFPVIDPAPKS